MIGMTSVTFRNNSVEEIIALCKESYIECIEWGGDIHVPPNNIENAERVGELTRNAGIAVSSYGSYFKVGVNSVDDFKMVLAAANALNAPVIRVWCGDKGSKNTNDDELLYYVSCLKEMCKLSKQYDITIACEFHNNTYNDSAKTALELINQVDCDNFKTYWQTLNYNQIDYENLKALNKNIVNIHVFSWNKQGKRYALKKKYKIWQDYIKLSKACNVNYIIEFVKKDSQKQFLKDVKILKELLDGGI